MLQALTNKSHFTFWKIIFWVYLMEFILALVAISTTKNFIFELLFVCIIESILLITVYLYTYQKKIFNSLFWKIIFALVIPIRFFFLIAETIQILQTESYIVNLIFNLIFYTPMLFSCFALYLYAFKFMKNKKTALKTNSLLWKMYFWLISVTTIFLFFAPKNDPNFQIEGWLKLIDIIDIPLSIIGIICLYAFIWQRKILKRIFWKIFFIANISFSVLTIPYGFSILKAEMIQAPEFATSGSNEAQVYLLVAFILIILFLPFIPAFIANYLYAYKSKEIWQKQK
jgi:hypothetical protein